MTGNPHKPEEFDFGFNPRGHYIPQTASDLVLRPLVEYYARDDWFGICELGDLDETFKRGMFEGRLLEVTLEAHCLEAEIDGRDGLITTMVSLTVEEELDGLGRELALEKAKIATAADNGELEKDTEDFSFADWPTEPEEDYVVNTVDKVLFEENGAFLAESYRTFTGGYGKLTLPLDEIGFDDKKENSLFVARHIKILHEGICVLKAPKEIKQALDDIKKYPVVPM